MKDKDKKHLQQIALEGIRNQIQKIEKDYENTLKAGEAVIIKNGYWKPKTLTEFLNWCIENIQGFGDLHPNDVEIERSWLVRFFEYHKNANLPLITFFDFPNGVMNHQNVFFISSIQRWDEEKTYQELDRHLRWYKRKNGDLQKWFDNLQKIMESGHLKEPIIDRIDVWRQSKDEYKNLITSSLQQTEKAKPKEKVFTIEDYLSDEGLKNKERIIERIKGGREAKNVHHVLIAAHKLEYLNFDPRKKDFPSTQKEFANLLLEINPKAGTRQNTIPQLKKLAEEYYSVNPGKLEGIIKREIQELRL